MVDWKRWGRNENLPLSGRGSGLTDAVDGVELLPGQLDCCAHHVLFEVFQRGGSRDREHGAGALEEPGERDLTGSSVVPLRDLVERSTLASKLSGCQRGPGDIANTLVCTTIYHRFVRTIHQIIAVLHGDNWYDRLC